VVDVSTITADAVIVTVSVLFGGVTYTDMATLTKVWDGLPAPMKLPMATTETPKNVNGEPLVSGDFFLVGAEFIEGGVTYEVGTLWEYTGTSWVISSDKMKALNAMGDFASIASEAEDGVFCRLIAKEVYAQSAVIEEIGTKEITVKEDGSVGSEDFAENEEGIPTSGYKLDNPLTPLGRRGRVRAHGGIFNNTTIYGSIIHDALVTRKSAPTTPVAFPSKTAWNRKDFWNALSVTENSADMIATNLNIAGTAYSYLRKITSASYLKTMLSYQSLAKSEWSAVTTYTSPGTGFVDINGKVQTLTFSISRVQVYKNGALIFDYNAQLSKTLTFSDSVAVNKGDTIGWRYQNVGIVTCELGINWRSPQNCLHYSNSTSSWDTFTNMPSDYLARERWQCSDPITFDSNNNIVYALANSFISGFSGLPEGVSIQTDSTVSKVTYGSLSNTPITSVIYYGSGIRLYYSSGYVTFQSGTNTDGPFTGWYNASASISVLSKEGIVVSNIIPKDDTREIGEFDNPFKKGFFEEINASGTANVASINTGGLGAFLIGQNLRTTDSPTFAAITAGTINTGYGDNEVFKISKETLDFGTVGGSADTVTKQISAMAIDEIRFVNTTGTMSSSTQNDYLATLKAPAGGTYLIIGAVVSPNYGTPVQTGGFLFSGGSTIWSIGEESDDTKSLNTAFIIRKLTS